MATGQKEQPAEYRCPGERSTISRAVHLGRLARFYPACRECPRRDETATLSPRQIRRLAETRRRAERPAMFHDEGAAGVYLNELDAAAARGMAAALGILLRHDGLDRVERAPCEARSVVVVAGDGRPVAAELVAAASHGLRWAGWDAVEIGPATAPCAALAIDHLQAAGGILLGGPTGAAHRVGMRFWARGAVPLSRGGSLEPLKRIVDSGADRPTRKFGTSRRFQADVPYLGALAEYYHGLRPLRFVLDTDCPPVVGYLEKLTGELPCEVIHFRAAGDRLAGRVLAERAHFAVRIDDDGQRCRLVDDRGRPATEEQFFLLLARYFLLERPDGTIVIEDDVPEVVVQGVCGVGGRVVMSSPRRAAMYHAMRENGALFGGGPSGRFWYRSLAGHYAADGLMALTMLLRLLSRSDRRLSSVLDGQRRVR